MAAALLNAILSLRIRLAVTPSGEVAIRGRLSTRDLGHRVVAAEAAWVGIWFQVAQLTLVLDDGTRLPLRGLAVDSRQGYFGQGPARPSAGRAWSALDRLTGAVAGP